ncbi:MAG: hypothetical protein QME51_01200, partial [Planctomycetota bacterium]|nr:hypothetical protein [Planctomycetota bacterium]
SEKNNLIKQLKDKKMYGVSEGESEISGTKDEDLGFAEPTDDNLRRLQKQFWIQEAFFWTMLNSEVARCEQLVFPTPPQTKTVSFTYGSVIPFSLKVSISSQNLPVFANNLLGLYKREITPLFLIINAISITRILDEIKNLPVVINEKPVLEKDKDNYKPLPIKEPRIRLEITGEVLDFYFPSEIPPPPPKKDTKEEKRKRPLPAD